MKVVTWNINGGYGLNPDNPKELLGFENLTYFTEQLEQIDAEVVCLQEAHVNAERSQAHEIARSLGYTAVFESIASESHIDSSYHLANAILARQPFQSTHAVTLPRPHFPLALPTLASGEQAAVHDKLLQVVQLNGLTIANTHLLPLPFLGAHWDSREGRELASAIAEVLEVELQPPLILCGDFNYLDLADLMPDLLRGLKLTNALPDQPSQPHAEARVDYILVSGEFEVVSSEILKCSADHFPCVAVLSSGHDAETDDSFEGVTGESICTEVDTGASIGCENW